MIPSLYLLKLCFNIFFIHFQKGLQLQCTLKVVKEEMSLPVF